MQLAEMVATASRWIDAYGPNRARDYEAQLWGRVAKVGEECGEVIAAMIGATGQNPRKAVTHTLDDVREELLDVALTALAAYEHMTDNEGACIRDLERHVIKRLRRVGLMPDKAPDGAAEIAG